MQMFRSTNMAMCEHPHNLQCNPFFIDVKIGLNMGTCEQGIIFFVQHNFEEMVLEEGEYIFEHISF